MEKLKKFLLVLMCLTVVLSTAAPAMRLTAQAATYVATGTLNTKVRLSDYETNSINGQTHTPRKYHFTNVKGAPKVENRQAYCININVGFIDKDLSAYKGFVPSQSTYFQSLSAAKQKGIVLTMAFGYPSNDYKTLGADNANQAIAATQILIWEFLTGVRTKFTGDPSNNWAKAGLSGKALTAYNRILSSINEYLTKGGEYNTLLSNAEVLIWDNGDNAQQMITYIGKPPHVDERGAIEVIKKDNNGNNLAGAVFKAINIETKKEYQIGPTDANGYAISEGGKEDPRVEYGTYTIVEWVVPDGYTAIGDTSWTVTVDKDHPVITLQAINRKKASVRILKESDSYISYYQNKRFGIYNAATNERLFSLNTGSSGITDTVQLPGDGNYYAIEENAEGCKVEWYNGRSWTAAEKYHFSVPADCDANGLVTLRAKNSPLPGTVTVKKTSEDGVVAGFEMTITDVITGEIAATGRTDINGTLVSDRTMEWVDFAKEYGNFFVIDTETGTGDINLVTANYCLLVDPWTTVGEIREALVEKGFTGYNLWNNDYTLCTLDDSDPVRSATDWGVSLDWGFAAKQQENGGYPPGGAIFIVVFGGSYDWDYDEQENPISEAYINEFDLWWATSNIGAEATTFIRSSNAAENDSGGYAMFLALDVNKNAVIDQGDVDILQEAYDNKTILPATPIQLPTGAYILSEVLDPDGQSRYIPPENKRFFVEPHQNTEIFMHNRLKKTGIYITKSSEDGVIADVEFRVTGTLESGETFDITTTTDEDGVIWITEDGNKKAVTVGTYTITELNVPKRYETPRSQTVTITAADIAAGDPITVEFKNMMKDVPLTILKTSEDNLVAGITFNVSGFAVTGEYINQTFTTDSEGLITTNILPGEYTVVEIMDTSGKYVDTEPEVIKPHYNAAGEPEDNEISFHNIRKKFTLRLYKQDGLTGQVFGDGSLDGAVYGLYKDGVLVEQSTTANNGTITFLTRFCESGYTVQEISPSPGYLLDPTVYDVPTDPSLYNDVYNNLTVSVTEQPIMGVFNIVKEIGNEEIRVAEAGAEFQVWLKSAGSYENAAEEERDILVTDSADPGDPMGYDGGVATSKELPYGVYVVHQTKGDSRFEYVEDFEITISGDLTSETYTLLNETKPHPVVLSKMDLGGTEKLPGAEFVIYDKSGTQVHKGTTDTQGEVTVNLLPGTYTWQELKAPEAYVLNSTVMTFTMDIYGNVTGTTTVKNDVTRYTVKKVDSSGNALAGATFQMIKDTDGSVFDTQVSGADGLVTFTKIPIGSYTVKETGVPAGYKLSTRTLKVTITEDWTNKAIGEFDDVFSNDPTTVTLYKIEAGTMTKLPGAEITIYDEQGAVYKTATTNEDGEITITGIVPGRYTFKETKVPAGYQLNTAVYSFTVSETGDVAGDDTIPNEPTKVVLTKTDLSGEKFLQGAEITVYDESGEVVLKEITGTDGTITATYLKPGKYTFKETAAVSGFALNTSVFHFEIDEYGTVTGDNTITDDVAKYTVKKTDAQGEALAGATFQLIKDTDGSVFDTQTSGTDGLATFSAIPYGSYTVKETGVPAGYQLSKQTLHFTIDSQWVNKAVGEFDDVFVNDKTTITFNKVSSNTSDPLAGAEIAVYNESGEVYASGMTNQAGQYVLVGIVPGQYTFKETVPPAGYQLNTTVYSFTVSETGDVAGDDTITDPPTEVVLKKTDVATAKPLSGAEITVYNEGGEVVAKDITGSDGNIVITHLKPGKYTFKETGVPAGYQLNPAVFGFEIDINGVVTGDNAISNEPTKVVLTKTDLLTSDPLAGATIAIYDSANNQVFVGTSSDLGQVVVTYLKPGKYTFKETAAPAGYQLNPEVFTFEIDTNGVVTGDNTLPNEPTKVVLTKTDLSGEKLLQGAEITVYDESGEVVLKEITGTDGTITATYLKPGKYTFKETSAVNGFAINTETFSFEIDENGNVTGDNTIADDITRLRIHKINDKNEPLAGVEFTMCDSSGEIVSVQLTDENGVVEFTGFVEGEYTIRETKAAYGYVLVSDEIIVSNDGTWDNQGEYASWTVINKPIIGTFELEYDEPLPTEKGNPEEGTPIPVPKMGDSSNRIAACTLVLGSAALFVLFRKKEQD